MTLLTTAVALGANLGDPAATLGAARRMLSGELGLLGASNLAWSALYRTVPVGPPQPDFLNAALVFQSPQNLTAPAVMELLLATEKHFGRTRTVRFGPRTLDLDLILHGQVTRQDSFLTLPHPRAHERAFVMVPLMDVGAMLNVPGHGTVQSIAQRLDKLGVRRVIASDAW